MLHQWAEILHVFYAPFLTGPSSSLLCYTLCVCVCACSCLYGGAPRGPQARALAAGPHLLIATPGRLLDFITSGGVNVSKVTAAHWLLIGCLCSSPIIVTMALAG